MPQIAIVGSGPAGYYAAEAAIRQWGEEARVDVYDRLPVPYGLISSPGPHHQSSRRSRRRMSNGAVDNSSSLQCLSRCDVIVGDDGALHSVILATGPHMIDSGNRRRRAGTSSQCRLVSGTTSIPNSRSAPECRQAAV